MEPKDAEDMNIPRGALVELIYKSSNIDPEPVYYEEVGRRSEDDLVDLLLCRLRPKSKVIARSLEAIERIDVYEKKLIPGRVSPK